MQREEGQETCSGEDMEPNLAAWESSAISSQYDRVLGRKEKHFPTSKRSECPKKGLRRVVIYYVELTIIDDQTDLRLLQKTCSRGRTV